MSGLPPISTPSGLYRGKTLNVTHLPVWSGADQIEDPRLAITDVSWQPGRVVPDWANKNPSPEMGSRLDGSVLGGKITICVLCHGDYYNMHRKCLNSILQTVPTARMDLRVAANCVGEDTENYLRSLPISKLYEYRENAYKYPIMRDMLQDDETPITTDYTVWFDDDAFAQHNNWVNLLADDISRQPESVGLYGLPLYYRLKHRGVDPRDWFRKAQWFKGKEFRNVRGVPAPNGDIIHFCAGWFWAIRTDIIKACDIPCPRLVQRGGDIVIGEQLYQNGYNYKQFNVGKALIYTPARGEKPRRPAPGSGYPWERYTE